MAPTLPLDKKLVKQLPAEIKSIVRSGVTITSMAQCVEELVFNAIDAGAKTILIGVNIDQFNVRVEDDGQGISEPDLQVIGERYSTSKCHSLDDLTRLKFYGFRGEALASIVNVSSTVDLTTRPKDTVGIELKKKFEDGHASGFVEKYNTKITKPGTIITVSRLLSKLPVRQKRIDKSIQLEEVKNCLEKIALVNPSLNIELRNEKLGSQIFDFKTSTSYSDAFDKLFKNRIGFEADFHEEHFLFKYLFFNLSVSKKFYKTKNYQFVYVNSRFIQRNRIYKWLGRGILTEQLCGNSVQKGDKYPIFILNINTPLNQYDVTLEPKKQKIEFKVWDDVLRGIEGIVSKLKLTNSCGETAHRKCEDNNVSLISSHNVKGAVHSRFAARPEENSLNQSNRSNSDRGSVGKSSASGSGSNMKTLTRRGHSSRIVDVRALRKKRKMESIIHLPKLNQSKMMYSIGNKPLLTAEIFENFKEWKGEMGKRQNNTSITETLPKKFKPNEVPELQQRIAAVTDHITSSSTLTGEKANKSRICQDAVPSPTALSVYNWKINRYFDNHQQVTADSVVIDISGDTNTSPVNQTSDAFESKITSTNSLDGLSDSLSQRDSRQETPVAQLDKKYQMQITSKAGEYMKNLVEKWKLPTTRTSVLDKILKYYKTPCQTNLKQFPVQSSQRSNPPERPSSSLICPNSDWIKRKALNRPAGMSFSEMGLRTRTAYNQMDQLQDCSLFKNVPSQNSIFTFFETETNKPVSEKAKPGGDFKIPAPPPRIKQVPQPLNLFPYQKSFSMEWNDAMLSEDYKDCDKELFPPETDWSVEIVIDQNEQEWLQTEDTNGKRIFINLSTGDSSYDMVTVLESVKVTAGEMKKCNPTRYKWLQRKFPHGFKQFLNAGSREVHKHGDLTKIETSIIKDSVISCLNMEQQAPRTKWKDGEFQNVSKYFNESENLASTMQIVSVGSGKKSNLQSWRTFSGATSSIRFSKEDFECIQVIGQLDKKFILAAIRKSSTEHMTLVIFDQHAVHERIRLEQLISDSFKSSKNARYIQGVEVMPPYLINFSESEVRLMNTYRDVIYQAGVEFEVVNSVSVKIKSVPKCFFEKCAAESSAGCAAVFSSLTNNLIKELIHHIMETKGAGLIVIPKAIHDVLSSQACHGAIKFGDELNLNKCRKLISDLKNCNSMFQCAHGRPTVTPLIKADDLAKTANVMLPERKYSSPEDHSLINAHDECSKYFCDFIGGKISSISSGYASASFLEAKATNDCVRSIGCQGSVNKELSNIASEQVDFFVPRQCTSFFNDTAEEDDEDQESPYFFKGLL